MITLRNYYLLMYAYILFFVCSMHCMRQEKKSEIKSHVPAVFARGITINSRDPSSVQDIHAPLQADAPKSNGRNNANAEKACCELQATCCKKTMKCSALILAAVLVITTGAIAYYLYGLQDTCTRLIEPVINIRDSMEQALPLAKNAIELANQSLDFARGAEPKLEGLYNSTAQMCLNAQATCHSAEIACKNPFGP